jgi:Mg2+/Co2+ transporter CorB
MPAMFSTPELLLALAAVLFLLACSFFFSGSETAMTAASRARLHQLEAGGDPRAAIVVRLLEARERLIGSLLIGNNIVNTAAASLTTAILLSIFGEVGVIYATVVVAALVIVFSEVMPKLLAINHPERMALIVAPAIRIVVLVFTPIATAIERFVRFALRLFGVPIGAGTSVVSGAEEIRGTVDLLAKEGSVAREERHMLGGLLDLEELDVADIMVHRTAMTTIDAELPMAEIVKTALDGQFTRVPVWRGTPENIVGVLHGKELTRALHAAGGDVDKLVLDDLISPPWFVLDQTSLGDQLKAFQRRKAHIALVVDEYGVVMGLVTLEDIIEEIVGEIDDETDEPIPGLRMLPDGAVSADGQVHIRDLNRRMDWALPDDAATTIAGLVIHEARVIPDAGQAFTFYGFTFQVLRRERNRITRLRITPGADARRAPAQGAPNGR